MEFSVFRSDLLKELDLARKVSSFQVEVDADKSLIRVSKNLHNRRGSPRSKLVHPQRPHEKGSV